MNRTLSIIIPTFKARDLLDRSLASIHNQSFKDFEVIVVDGFSEDGTIDIIEKYREQKLEVVFISEPDKGVYDAMNKGIKIANGEWLYFLGAGDTFYDNSTLSKLTKYFNSDFQIIQGDIIISSHKNTIYKDRLSGLTLLVRNFCHQGLFYRKAIFNLVGDYNLSYPIIADWEFNLRWFFNRKISRVYVPLIICDFLGGGLSANVRDNNFHKEKELIIRNLLKKNPKAVNYFLVLIYRVYESCSTKNKKRINRFLKIN